MDVGVCLPYMERDLSRERLLSWCRAIDEGPFSSLSCGERITGHTIEMVTTLGAAAAVTERVRIVPSLYVLPMHSAVRAAKEIATLDLISNGRVTVTVGVGGPSRWCDLPEEKMEPGLDWNMWLGAAPMRPYNSVLSPRGVLHNHFPAWRQYREYSGGGHTDMGAHHYDIAQWALGMDDSGPVEIIPPEDPNATRGAKYIFANGVEMTHGGPGGCVFTGTRGKLRIDRGHLSAEPESIIKEPLGKDEVHLYESPGHHRDWIDCIRSRKRPVADVEIGARTVTVVHLGNLAYWHRKRLRWDPKNWKFVDGHGDAKWLDRERRDPWQLPSA